jgi:hypothetical protein
MEALHKQHNVFRWRSTGETFDGADGQRWIMNVRAFILQRTIARTQMVKTEHIE